MDNKNKVINCKVCGLSNEVTKFQVSRKTCIKCNSKICNQKCGKDYFKEYYCENMDKICNDSIQRYYKNRIPSGKPLGRPKKVLII